MSKKRAKQRQVSVAPDAIDVIVKGASARGFVWHMVDMASDESTPVTLCGIGRHAGAKRGWRYGHEGFTPKLERVNCPDCKRILADREEA